MSSNTWIGKSLSVCTRSLVAKHNECLCLQNCKDNITEHKKHEWPNITQKFLLVLFCSVPVV